MKNRLNPLITEINGRRNNTRLDDKKAQSTTRAFRFLWKREVPRDVNGTRGNNSKVE